MKLFSAFFLSLSFARCLHAAPAATRALPDTCVGGGEAVRMEIVLDPGTPAPGVLILEERPPKGWTLISSTWNGSPMPPDHTGPLKWIFGLSTPVEAGTLCLELMPAPALERSYAWSGHLKYGDSLTVPVLGDQRMEACDRDSDTLPDDWEVLYFGSPTGADPEGDDDDDGADNLAEYESLTVPTDAESYLGFVVFDTRSSPWKIQVRGGGGAFVSLRHMDSLEADGPRHTVGGQIIPSDGKAVFYVDPVQRGFFLLETPGR